MEAFIQGQNGLSSSCIKPIRKFIRQKDLEISKSEFKRVCKVYQTDFEFIAEDIQKFREQGISDICFSVLHPWEYDLDSIDF